MPLGDLFSILWPSAPSPTPAPDILIAVDEPGAEVIVTYRKTTRSKRVYVEAWAGAVVVKNVNGVQS